MRLSGIAQNVENMLVHPATQGQLDALIDFSYNEGLHALQGSTLLKLFNAGDLIGAARQFGEWDLSMYQGRMQILQGLVRRRTAECVRFCGLG
jgi:lysozyme